MIVSYLTVAFRNFVKERFFSLLNIAGLSLGLAVVFLIGLYIVYELGFDRFHNQPDRTYRVVTYLEMGSNQGDYNATFAPMAQALREDVPEVEVAVRLTEQDGIIFSEGNNSFPEDNVLYADADFFKLFNFRILSGDPSQILAKPYQVLLTPFLVAKYFGKLPPEQSIGRSIEIDREMYTISGIVEESPANSHLRYNAIASLSSLPVGSDNQWLGLKVNLYVRLKQGTDPATVNGKFEGLLRKHITGFDGMKDRGITISPFLQTLTSIHLYSDLIGEVDSNSSITTLYIFASVGFVVLLLACVNFVNLTTARAANRAKEVGVRKVVGAGVIQLMRQFILEAILMVFLAAILAVLIVVVAQYPFNVISGKAVSAAVLVEPLNLLILVVFVVLLGVVAGSYPAFILTAFSATRVLRGTVAMGFRSRTLRSTLVVIQFAVAIILITATLVVDEQLGYMRSRKLGFDQENVIVIENGDKITDAAAFQKMLGRLPQVRDVGTGSTKPIGGYDGMPMAAENMESIVLVNYSTVDAAYLKTLQYRFVEGQNFSPVVTDTAAVILNQSAAVALLGDKPLGKKLVYAGQQPYTVIGIVEDFNYQSLRNAILPVVFFYKPDQRYICVRFKPGDPTQGVSDVEALWKKQYPRVPFVFTYLDETYTSLYKGEVQLGVTFGIFTVLALVIACLGLVGLAVYMAQQRHKEISVRKVFGASIAHIALLLSREFIRLILVACLLAVPAAYYIMTLWLNDFAYHISVGPWVLVLGCVVVLLAGVGAVAYQSIRASLLNPGQSLKEE